MKRPNRPASDLSKVSAKDQAGSPRSMLLDKTRVDDPFGAFSEWADEADEKAFGVLCGRYPPRHGRA
jgi:hypothetical protein